MRKVRFIVRQINTGDFRHTGIPPQPTYHTVDGESKFVEFMLRGSRMGGPIDIERECVGVEVLEDSDA